VMQNGSLNFLVVEKFDDEVRGGKASSDSDTD